MWWWSKIALLQREMYRLSEYHLIYTCEVSLLWSFGVRVCPTISEKPLYIYMHQFTYTHTVHAFKHTHTHPYEKGSHRYVQRSPLLSENNWSHPRLLTCMCPEAMCFSLWYSPTQCRGMSDSWPVPWLAKGSTAMNAQSDGIYDATIYSCQ